jgi:hypothetical protein
VCAEPPSATTPVNFDAFGAPTEVYLAVMSAANYTASVVWGENGTQAVVAGDDEPPIVWAVLVLAEREGHPDLGEVWMDGYQAYVQPWLDLANYGDKSWWRLEREL